MDLRICHAIAERRLLMFGYKGVVRTVEPHLAGRTTAGHEALSAWMRPGWSRTDPQGGWRMFLADAIEELQLLPERFDGPRPRFNPEDPLFTEVFCRLEPAVAGTREERVETHGHPSREARPDTTEEDTTKVSSDSPPPPP